MEAKNNPSPPDEITRFTRLAVTLHVVLFGLLVFVAIWIVPIFGEFYKDH